MSFIGNRVYDNGLGVLQTETTHFVLCSALPGTFTEANVTYKLASKAAPTVSAPAAGSPDGRQVTVSPFVGGACSADGTAGYYACIDATNSRLLWSGELVTPRTTVNGDPFSLSNTIVLRLPAAP
jgi:hypothetical protein